MKKIQKDLCVKNFNPTKLLTKEEWPETVDDAILKLKENISDEDKEYLDKISSSKDNPELLKQIDFPFDIFRLMIEKFIRENFGLQGKDINYELVDDANVTKPSKVPKIISEKFLEKEYGLKA